MTLAEATSWQEVLTSLVDAGKGRRAIARIGRKASALSALAREGMPVPEGWVLDSRHFDAFVERCLPRKHDMKTLVRLAGTRAGDERCARAYEELLGGEMDEALVAAVEALWQQTHDKAALGLAVRPSLVASGEATGAAAQHLHSRVGLTSAADIVAAIREVWASAVLSCAVGAYARGGLKSVSLAVILQVVVRCDDIGLLTRTPGPNAAVGQADWHVGVLLPPKGPREWRRSAQMLLPLAAGEGAAPPEPLRRLIALLGNVGYEALIELGRHGEKALGASAVLQFALTVPSEGQAVVHVLNADDGPRWLVLGGGDDATTWAEVALGGRPPEPPTRLTQTVVERVVVGAASAVLESLRCKLDPNVSLVSSGAGRTYLNIDALLRAARDIPLLSAEDLLYALGGVGAERMGVLAGRLAAQTKSTLRLPFIGAAAVLSQVTLESDTSRSERAIEREIQSLLDMDLTLLPSDAMATTLTAAQSLVERAAELWAESAAALLTHRVAARALVRRRVPDVDVQVGYALTTGAERLFTTSMASSLARVVEVFRRDPEASKRLADPGLKGASDLPDGPGRGALGQFLSIHGDLAFGAFELCAPRWREDAGEVMRMVALLLEAGQLHRVDELARQSRAAADAELARYEPELAAWERRLLRAVLDRVKDIVRMRAHVERLMYRTLSAARRVVLDIDRRLRRMDSSMQASGAFHCSAQRLVRGLKSGHPDLSRIIRMRTIERDQLSHEPAPPQSFVASPPRGAIPIVHASSLQGMGVSPGVVEGRVRLVHGALPAQLERGDILCTTSFDAAMTPLCLALGGVICETGGALAVGAEAARDLSVPMVASVDDALLQLEDGERVRLDGTRGVVQRLSGAARR
jgi:phosphohistidine swiveling domain-containing protein